MARYYTAEMCGPVCRHCLLKVPHKLATNVHPSCGPEAAAALRADRLRDRAADQAANAATLLDVINGAPA